jgi:Family of unknown function (DUF5681)
MRKPQFNGGIMTGYKSPPLHSRFKPGQSGNPAGRPARKPTLQSELHEVLLKTTEVRGSALTNLRCITEILVAKAVQGNFRAMDIIFRECGANGPQDTETSPTPAEEQEILREFLADNRSATVSPEVPSDRSLQTDKE